MKKQEPNEWSRGKSPPEASLSDLRGKQSVRATFRLSEGCIDAISIVARQLGIKQKSIFDHFAEDARALTSIASQIQNARPGRRDRIQKTYVISKKSLRALDEISRSFKAPRDALVERSVHGLFPVITREREKHEKRKRMMTGITAHFTRGMKLLEELEEDLGQEDPMYDRFSAMMEFYKNTHEAMEVFINKGRAMENFNPARMKGSDVI